MCILAQSSPQSVIALLQQLQLAPDMYIRLHLRGRASFSLVQHRPSSYLLTLLTFFVPSRRYPLDAQSLCTGGELIEGALAQVLRDHYDVDGALILSGWLSFRLIRVS